LDEVGHRLDTNATGDGRTKPEDLRFLRVDMDESMSDDVGGKKSKLWEIILEEEPTPAVQKAVEARLAEFEKHRKALLDHLSKNRRFQFRPFDEEKWWLRLTRLAQAYFLRQAMPSAAKREADLRKLAEALGRVCRLAERLRQDNVGSEWISQLFDGILPREPRGEIARDEDGSLRVVYFREPDFKEIVANLKDYQAAVLRVANDVPTRPPGPSPSLPESYIRALRDAYQESTRRSAGRGVGPFLRFVMQFRAALDPSYKSTDESGDERVDESLLDAIKHALRKPRAFMPLHGQQAKDRD
jgi:hypothetical protein